MKRLIPVALAATITAAAAVGVDGQGRGSAGPCDRTCLITIADAYMTALAARDPARAAIAPNARFTENTGVLTLGEGLWIGASDAADGFRIHVPDPTSGQVGVLGVMKEFDRPVLLALRLRVQNRQITEIEHLVARTLNENGLKNLDSPRPALLADVPAAARKPRVQMLRLADGYYDSLVDANSRATAFADDCVRHENGMRTSANRNRGAPVAGSPAAENSALSRLGALGWAEQVDTRMFTYVTGIDLRRVGIADEQRGLVYGLSMFRHRGNVRKIKILNVPGLDTMEMNFGPIDLQAAHIFKIHGGRIHEIEAMGYTLPYKSNSGWEP